MFYRPLLSNGKPANLPWQLRLFQLNSNWPLREDPAVWMKIIDKFSLTVEFLSFIIIVESEYNYIVQHRHNLGLMLETLATAMVSTECFFRIFNMVYKRQDFRNLIRDFYEDIYIERTPETEEIFAELQRKSRPTRICSYTYFTTLFTYFLIPIIGFFKHQLLFPFRLLLHYDYHPLPVYIPTLLTAIWAGCLVVSQLVAEANMLATLILNLNGRYMLLQRDLQEACGKLQLNQIPSNIIAQAFRHSLIKVVRRNFQLNRFARLVQEQYSFRIFVMMGLSALLLCVLGFKVVTVGWSSQNITYVLWICTKIVELVVFGEVGSTIIETTDRMSLSYYLSDWENIILHSDNTPENIKTMRFLAMAIGLNQKPIYFTGFDFFSVRLSTVIAILRGAGSYFTCLYAFY